MVFAYLGPETTLPLTSVLAAVTGFVLMVGRKPLLLARKIFQRFTQG